MRLSLFVATGSILISTVFIHACSPNNDLPDVIPVASVTESPADLNSFTPSTPVSSGEEGLYDVSAYYSNQTAGKIEEKEKSIVWTYGDITLRADKATEGQGPDAVKLYNITIAKGDQSYSIQPQEHINAIESVSLSDDGKFMAVSLFTGAGSNLHVTDLSSGVTVDLNLELENQGNGFVESIQAYNWSPVGHDLAIAYGDTSSSKFAVYHADNRNTRMLSSSSYISTAYALWSRDGMTIDYVSEQPSDHYRLYRYHVRDDVFDEGIELSRDDMSKLSGLIPAPIDH